ncbi:DUF6268 family outer membrane beta-barrel protein [Marinifilum caeruleilacunae]|uniref:DUF6268 domain-containing protein n=1 Tax=Marinifilum caeruleilacunae TaxID=2499076 RepID=A0ABX1WVT7_9BACT|nr:DUF6268 family outer membrane beta-barrel protein [Marinifilum caeruleilacunae]NOU60207.1 hypothetical protein [Marinifilum caeruleilacunae]
MKEKVILFVSLLLITSFTSIAQFGNERFNTNYTHIGKGDASTGSDVSFEKYSISLTFPKSLNQKGLRIFHTVDYAKTNIEYGIVPDLGVELENFHSIGYTFGISKPLKKGWFLTAFVKPNISSNFDSSVSWDELNLFGMALFTKPINQKKNLMLSIGAIYSNTLGFPAPIPVASLMWKPDKKWTINFGFPRMDVNYQLSPNTQLGANLLIAGENFSLSDKIRSEDGNTTIDNVGIMNIGGGIYLNQKIAKKITVKANAGHTFSRNFEFNDGTDKVVDFDLDNNFFVSAGISIGI